jgi:hypothetical protein
MATIPVDFLMNFDPVRSAFQASVESGASGGLIQVKVGTASAFNLDA